MNSAPINCNIRCFFEKGNTPDGVFMGYVNYRNVNRETVWGVYVSPSGSYTGWGWHRVR